MKLIRTGDGGARSQPATTGGSPEASTRSAEHSTYLACLAAAQTAIEANNPDEAEQRLRAAPESERGWEWNWLRAMVDSSRLTIATNRPSADVIRYSSDGRFLLATDGKNAVKIWNAATGALEQVLGNHGTDVIDASFSRDGRLVVTASQDCTARIWNSLTGKELTVLRGDKPPTHAEFSPDASRVLTLNASNEAHVWSVEAARILFACNIPGAAAESAEYDPQHDRILTAHADGAARVWSGETGKLTAVLGEHARVSTAHFGRDGKRIVTASADAAIRIWDSETGREVSNINDTKSKPVDVELGPDSKMIMARGADGCLRMWDAATGKDGDSVLACEKPILRSEFSADGAHVLTTSSDRVMILWDAAFSKLEDGTHWKLREDFRADDCEPGSAHISPDGRSVVARCGDQVKIWDTSETRLRAITRESRFSAARASVRFGEVRAVVVENTQVVVKDATSRRKPLEFVTSENNIIRLRYNRDGTRVVTGQWDGTAKIWNAETGECLRVLRGHTGAVRYADFSYDGSRIATISDDCTVRIWNCDSGEMLIKIEKQKGAYTFAAFSPDGTQLMTSGEDACLRVWNAATGAELMKCKGPTGMYSAVFSHDGKSITIVGDDGTLSVLDAVRGIALRAYKVGELSIHGASFSPDGKRVFAKTTSEYCIIDAESGDTLMMMPIHEKANSSDLNSINACGFGLPDDTVHFSPDGTYVVVTDLSGRVEILDSVPYRERAARAAAADGAASTHK